MKAFAAVFGRELAERRLLLLLALLLGFVPLAAPWIPGLPLQSRDELRGGVALALTGILTLVTAVLLGGSVIARELAERRLGFYFSRPIPGGSLWAGKLAAAVALVLASGLLAFTPAMLVGVRLSRALPDATGLGTRSALMLAGLGLLVILGAHAGSVIVRTRSPWLVLDLAALTLSTVLLASVLGGLQRVGALRAAELARSLALAALLVALAAASAAQVMLGRTDSRRAHRWLSLALWSVLLVGLGALQGYGQWVMTPAPRDLDEISGVQAAHSGNWAVVQGTDEQRGGYAPAFLIDTSSGRFLRLAGQHTLGGFHPVFASNGPWAVWIDLPEKDGRTFSVMRVDLRASPPHPSPTEVSYEDIPWNLTLSPDGRLLAAILRDRLLVHDLSTGRLLASVRLPRGVDFAVQLPRDVAFWGGFDDRGVLRLYQNEVRTGFPPILRIWELVPGQFQLRPTGRIVNSGSWSLATNRDRSRLVDATQGLRVFDARTGAVLAAAEVKPGDRSRYAGFLSDGRIVWIVETATGRDLRLLSSDLAEIRRFAFPGASGLFLGGEPAPGRLVVGVQSGRIPSTPADPVVVLLGLDSGARQVVARGVTPLSHYGRVSAGSAAHLFLDRSRLLWIDFATGRRRTLAGPGA